MKRRKFKLVGRGRASEGPSAMKTAPGQCNVTALRKASRRISQLYDTILAPSGLRSTQRTILAQIQRHGASTMGDLAEALVLDRSALAHNLKPLERDGLIEIVVDNEDRRSRRVKITKRGLAKLNVSVEGWQTAQRCFETAVGSKEATALRSVLATIASAEFAEKFDHALRS